MLSSEELDSSYSEFINFVFSQVYSCPIIGVYIYNICHGKQQI